MLGILTNLMNTYLLDSTSIGSLFGLTYFGIVCCVLVTGYLVCNYKFSWSCDISKGILCFFYGLNFGLFSVLYGLIIGFVILVTCFFKCQKM